jgi:hypothetical protein
MNSFHHTKIEMIESSKYLAIFRQYEASPSFATRVNKELTVVVASTSKV